MLSRISEASTLFFIGRQIIPQEKKKIYQYGFEVIYSTGLGLGSILCLGALLGAVPETLIFLAYFIVIRLFAGGYHAPTYGGCFILTNSVYLAERLLAECLPEHLFLFWVLFFLNLIYIWREAPAPNPYRKQREKSRRVNQRMARISLIGSTLLMMFCHFSGLFWVMSETVSALTVISGLIILTKTGGNH